MQRRVSRLPWLRAGLAATAVLAWGAPAPAASAGEARAALAVGATVAGGCGMTSPPQLARSPSSSSAAGHPVHVELGLACIRPATLVLELSADPAAPPIARAVVDDGNPFGVQVLGGTLPPGTPFDARPADRTLLVTLSY